MIVYTVTKIFGVDAVKTRVFRKKQDAIEDIEDTIKLLSDDTSKTEIIEKCDEEVYYIFNKSKKPQDYIEFILRRNEVK